MPEFRVSGFGFDIRMTVSEGFFLAVTTFLLCTSLPLTVCVYLFGCIYCTVYVLNTAVTCLLISYTPVWHLLLGLDRSIRNVQ